MFFQACCSQRLVHAKPTSGLSCYCSPACFPACLPFRWAFPDGVLSLLGAADAALTRWGRRTSVCPSPREHRRPCACLRVKRKLRKGIQALAVRSVSPIHEKQKARRGGNLAHEDVCIRNGKMQKARLKGVNLSDPKGTQRAKFTLRCCC